MCSQDETAKERKAKFQYIFWTTEITKCRTIVTATRSPNKKKSIVIVRIQAATPTLFTTCHSGQKHEATCFFYILEDTRLIHNGLDFQLVVNHHTFCFKNLFLGEEFSERNWNLIILSDEKVDSHTRMNTRTLLDPRSSLICPDSMITAYVYDVIGVTVA